MKIKHSLIASLSLAFLCLTPLHQGVADSSGITTPYQVGEWLPSDQKFFDDWLAKLVEETGFSEQPLLPVIQEFKDLIEKDPQLFMLFHQMFDQIPDEKKFSKDPSGKVQITNYHQMLQVMNRILTMAPEYNQTGLVGFPINAILNWPMGTPAGTEAFLNKKVNRQLKKILNKWAVFLKSPASRYVLTEHPENGWFGRDAKIAMPGFAEDFICDKEAPYYGFSSWDDFFTRQFRPGRRPVASPNDDAVIANACESAPYRIEKNVNLVDKFWIN